jgi:hypothetical protein
MYWYKNINNKDVKFIGDEMVGDNPAEYFKSPNITSWGHKQDYDGTVNICFPELWNDEDWWDDKDENLDGE